MHLACHKRQHDGLCLMSSHYLIGLHLWVFTVHLNLQIDFLYRMHESADISANIKDSNQSVNPYCLAEIFILQMLNPYVISRALNGEKPCIKKGFYVLLMHRKLIFNMIVPGPLKLYRLYRSQYNKLVVCNLCFCNGPIKSVDPLKMDPFKKKMFGPGLEPWVRDHYSAYGPIYPLVPQRSTVVSCNYHYYISTLCHYIFVL